MLQSWASVVVASLFQVGLYRLWRTQPGDQGWEIQGLAPHGSPTLELSLGLGMQERMLRAKLPRHLKGRMEGLTLYSSPPLSSS